MLALYLATGAILGALNARGVLIAFRRREAPAGVRLATGLPIAFGSWLIAWPVLGAIECGAMLYGDDA